MGWKIRPLLRKRIQTRLEPQQREEANYKE
jgi:hypothetical protein